MSHTAIYVQGMVKEVIGAYITTFGLRKVIDPFAEEPTGQALALGWARIRIIQEGQAVLSPQNTMVFHPHIDFDIDFWGYVDFDKPPATDAISRWQYDIVEALIAYNSETANGGDFWFPTSAGLVSTEPYTYDSKEKLVHRTYHCKAAYTLS